MSFVGPIGTPRAPQKKYVFVRLAALPFCLKKYIKMNGICAWKDMFPPNFHRMYTRPMKMFLYIDMPDVLLRYTFCVKISYVTKIEVTILSYKEKPWVHD